MLLPEARPLRLLISFSPEDYQLKEQLVRHLQVLVRFGRIEVWAADGVRPGDDWRQEFDAALDRTDVALLLMSASFMASEFLQDVEVPRLFQRHEHGGLMIIPVLLRSCLWQAHPWLGGLEPLPTSKRAIASLQEDDRDRALTEVAAEVEQRIRDASVRITRPFGPFYSEAVSRAHPGALENLSIEVPRKAAQANPVRTPIEAASGVETRPMGSGDGAASETRRRRYRRVLVMALVGGLIAAVATLNPRVRAIHNPPASGYSRALIRTIPDDCAQPWVILTTTSEANGSSYTWPVTRQVFRANRQFRIVSGDPAAPQQVHLAPYKYHSPPAYALVATCSDGATCNDVAAMYRAIVRSGAAPQLKCGRPEIIGDAPVGVFQWSADDRENLPSASDDTALCARINACEIAVDRSVEGDPFLECRRDPGRFKLSCATRDPCIEVLDCLARLDAVVRSWVWRR